MTIEFPTSIPNVILTEFQYSDAPSIVEFLDNDVVIHRNLRFLPQPYTLEDAKNYIKLTKDINEKNKRIQEFAIKEKDSGNLIGSCSFNNNNNPSANPETEIDIGYWIGQKYWNKGIGTGIIKTLLDIGFNKYHFIKIGAVVFEWNIPSQKILLKNGFQKEKVIENYMEKDGKMVNVIRFSKFKD